jgi:hemolysin activation/secretion protein
VLLLTFGSKATALPSFPRSKVGQNQNGNFSNREKTETPRENDEASPIYLKKVEILGNTAFPPHAFEEIIAPFKNKPITLDRLFSLRSAITDKYVEHGYWTSGAFLPNEQNISDGVIEIQVIEGQIERIEFKGVKKLNEESLKQRILAFVGVPLNVPKLREALEQLRLDPQIQHIESRLVEGTGPGYTVLIVSITEKP